eukprot:357567-Rhodomonas_salina.3
MTRCSPRSSIPRVSTQTRRRVYVGPYADSTRHAPYVAVLPCVGSVQIAMASVPASPGSPIPSVSTGHGEAGSGLALA